MTNKTYCPHDCECLGKMLAVCFARPLLTANGRGFTDNIPVVAQLKRDGENYIKSADCHYEKFRQQVEENLTCTPHFHHWDDGTYYSHSHKSGSTPHGHHGSRYGQPLEMER